MPAEKMFHGHTTKADKEPRLKGASGEYVTYDFPANLDDAKLREEIGYADVPGVSGFNCGNCNFFVAGRCAKFKIGVKKSACCSSWENRGRLPIV